MNETVETRKSSFWRGWTWLWAVLSLSLLSACGSAPQNNPAPVATPATVATVQTSFGAVTGLPGGKAQTTITVKALDANGRPVRNAPVSVTLTGSISGQPTLVAGAVTTINGVTGPTGIATLTLTYFVAPGLTVNVTAGGVTAAPVAAPVPTVARIVSSITPGQGVVADGYSNYTITATLYDAGNNLVSGDTVIISATSQQGGVVALSAASAVSSAAGTVSVLVSDRSVVDDYVHVTLHALSDVYAQADHVAVLNFTGSGSGSNTAANGDTLRIASVAPASVPADGVTAVQVGVQALDAYGNPIAGMPVTMTADLHAVVTPAFANTNAQGMVNFQVRDSYAETVNLLVSNNGNAPSAGLPGLVFTPYASQLTIVPDKTEILADGIDVATITITASGPHGVVAGERLRLSSSSASTVFSAPFVTTGANGKASFTVSDTGARKFTITARTRDGGALPGIVVSKTLDLYSAVVAPQVLVDPAGPFLADSYTAGHMVTIRVRDRNGVPMADQPITLTIQAANAGGPGTSAGISAQPLQGPGWPTLNVWSDATGTIRCYVSDSLPELVTLTATALDGTKGSLGIQFVAAQASRLNLSAPSLTAAPDGLTPIVLTTTVFDANNVAVPNAWVRFSTTDPYVNLSLRDALTNANGQVVLNLTSFTPVAAADIYASLPLNGNITATSRVSFVEPVASVLMSATPSVSAPADGNSAISVRVKVLGAAGQPLAGRVVTLAHQSFATVTAPGVTDAYGEVVVQVRDTKVETVSLTATVDGVASAPLALNFVPFANQIALTVTPAANVPGDGLSQATLTATVLDTTGAPLAGQLVRFVDVYGSSAVFSAFSATTNAAGQATVTLSDTTNEIVTVRAQADAYTATATVNFVLVNYRLDVQPVAANVPMLNGNWVFLADGLTKSLSMRVLDTNTGLAQPGQPFQLAITGAAVVQPVAVTTAQLSPYQATFGISDTTPELVTLTLTDAAGQPSTRQAQFVSAAASSLSIRANPLSVVPDGVASSTISVQVKDAYGAAVPNALVYFHTSDPYAVLVKSQVLSDATGVATTSIVSQVETQAQIWASLPLNGGVQSPYAQVAFEIPVAKVVLTVDQANLGVDAYATLTATVTDANGRPLAGRAVSFTTTGGAQLSAPNALSDVNGQAQVILRDATAETVQVTASSAGIVSAVLPVTFTPLVGSMNLSVLPGGSVPADGASTASVVVTLKDPYGAPVTGQTVRFLDDSYASSAQLSAANVLTDATGTAIITVKDTVAEAVNIRAIAGGKTQVGTVRFGLTNLQFIVSGNMPFLADGAPHPITIQALDAAGNPAAGQVFQISSASPTMIPSQLQVSTDVYGQATIQVSDGVAETANLTFDNGLGAGNNALSFTVPVQFVAANPASLTIQATPSAGVAPDGVASSVITVQVKDAYGAAVSNAWVQLEALNAAGATDVYASLSAGSVLTSITGQAQVTLSRTQAGSVTVRASLPRLPNVAAQTASVRFEAPVASVQVVSDVSSVDAYGTANVAAHLTATVLDAAGQPIVGRTVRFQLVGGTATLGTATALSDAQGQIASTLFSAVPGVAQVVAIADGVASLPVTVNFLPVTRSLSMVVTPTGKAVVADGISTLRLDVVVKDAYGSPVPGQTVRFFDDSFSSALLSASTVTTNASGLASITVSDPYVETVTIRAVAGSHPQSWMQVSDQLQFVASSLQLIVGGAQPFLADGKDHALSLQVKDVNGNPMTTPQAFVLSSSSTSMIPASLQVTSDAYGQATIQVRDSIAETATLTLTHVATNLTFSVPVQFISADPYSYRIKLDKLSAAASSAVSNADMITASVTVTDVYGALVPNAWVQFSALDVYGVMPDPYTTLSTTSPALSTLNTNTDFYGQAQVQIRRDIPGSVLLNVSLPKNPNAIAASSMPTLTFTVPKAQIPVKIALSASGYTLKSDGSDRVILTATVKDVNNVGVNGATVSFFSTSSGDAGLLSSSTAVTDAYGQASVSLSAGIFDRSNRTINVFASVAGLPPTPVLPIVVSGSTVAMQATPTSIVVGNAASSSAVKVALADAGGNPVPHVGLSGTATLSPGAVIDVYAGATHIARLPDPVTGATTWADPYTVTDTAGVVNYDVYAVAGAGGSTATLTVNALGASNQVSFVLSTPGDVFAIVSPYKTPIQGISLYGAQRVVVQASSLVIQHAIDLYAQGKKADPIARVKLSSSAGSWGALNADPYIIVAFPSVSPYTTSADFYASNLPGIVTIQADEYVDAATPPTVSDTVLLQVNAVTPATVTLTSSTSVVAPSLGGQQHTATITATVRDANNFAVSNIPVTFDIYAGPGGGERMQPVTVFTDSGGQAVSTFVSGTLSSAQNGVVVRGSVFQDGQVVSGTTALTIGASSVSVSLGSSTKIGASADGTSYILPMSALVTDANGSAIPGAVVTLHARPLYFAYGFRSSGKTLAYGAGDKAYWPGYLFDTTTTFLGAGNSAFTGLAFGFAAEDRNQNQILDVVTQGAPEDGYTTVVDFNSPFSGEITDLYTNYIYTDYATYWGVGVNSYAQVDAYVFANLQYRSDINGVFTLTSTTPGYMSTRPDGTPNCQPFRDAYGNVYANPTHWYCASMHDGVLTPAQASAGAVPQTVVTDQAGLAPFDFIYHKQYAGWVMVEVTATVQNTAGTESVAIKRFYLPESVTDLQNGSLLAAYPISPFGRSP